jgi:hypothetical protein
MPQRPEETGEIIVTAAERALIENTGEIHIRDLQAAAAAAANVDPAAPRPTNPEAPVLPPLGSREPAASAHAPMVPRPSLELPSLEPAPEPPAPADADDAPPLVMSSEEPTAIPSSAIVGLSRDADTLRTLRKLAGGQPDSQRARVALAAALRGENYDRADLPDGRTIALGVARLLVASGTPESALVDAIIAVLDDSA